jgi:phospholipase C
MTITRRGFLAGSAAAIAGGSIAKPAFANIALPLVSARTVTPSTPIDTTVVLMMENRSVDHYLGWYANENPRFRGVQHRTYTTSDGTELDTTDWGVSGRNEYEGCGFNDPGHSWNHGRVQIVDSNADSEPDGWVKDGSRNDEFALSYYGPDDVPVLAALTRKFTVCDKYFCSVLSSTYPNREYLLSCQGLKDNVFPQQTGNPEWAAGFTWPTIFDTLTERGVTWAIYYSNLPMAALWGSKYLAGARSVADYYAEAAAGLLPQVCFVEPAYTGFGPGSNDDHPHADLRLGQQFVSDVFGALLDSAHWPSAAFVLTYDEWGGFWDHITPPTVDDPRAADGFGQLGFRVPTVVASPYSRGGKVNHDLFDHTSIVRFIERNYGLRRLNKLDPNARFAGGRSLERVFHDFTSFKPNLDDDQFDYTAPPEAFDGCSATGALTAAKSSTPPATLSSDFADLAATGWFEHFGWRTDFRFEDSFRR